MKKLLALLMAFILTLALVGCEDGWKSWSDVFPEEEPIFYTREEVDELIQNAIDELQQQNTDVWKALNDRYVQMEIGDDNLYFHCTVDGMVKECESVNYQEQIDELIQNAINNDKNYTQEEVYDIINTLLIDMIDFKYDDMVDISYDEETKIFTITQYNQYNEVFSVDTYTIDEIMDELGYA